MATDVNNILDRISIESYISRYVKLKRRGNSYIGLCPFHDEKTSSFSVSIDKQFFKCFGCGKGGNLISFVIFYENVEFKEALQILADFTGIKLEYSSTKYQNNNQDHKQLLIKASTWIMNVYQKEIHTDTVISYLKERNILENTIQTFKIGYAPNEYHYVEKKLHSEYGKNKEKFIQYKKATLELGILKEGQGETYNPLYGRLIFPILNHQAQCVGFSGRVLPSNEQTTKPTAKYINSPDSILFNKSKLIYNLFQAKEFIRKQKYTILVEGYLDVIGLYQKEIYNVVATMGTAFTSEQAKTLKRYTDTIYLFFDNDNAGIQATLKTIILAHQVSLAPKVILYNQKLSNAENINEEKSTLETHLDPFEISQKLSKEELISLIDHAYDELHFIIWYFFSYNYNLRDIVSKKQAISTFFEYIQKLPQQWEQQEYIKVASIKLNIPNNILYQDFMNFQKKQPAIRQHTYQGKKTSDTLNKVPKNELEILTLLINFPALWEHKSLSLNISWNHTHCKIIYDFFDDRIHNNELWDQNSLKKLNDIFPEPVFSTLTSIIQLDDILHIDKQHIASLGEDEISYYAQKLEILMINHKVNDYDKTIENLKEQLSKLDNETISDNILEDINFQIKEKQKLIEYRHKVNTSISL